MTRLLIVSREIAPTYTEALVKALSEALGEIPATLVLHGGSQPEKLRREIALHKPQVVHFSSPEIVDEAGLEAVRKAAAIAVTDVPNLSALCARGALYGCNHFFCSDENAYGRAECFAYRLEDVENGLHGAKLFRKCLPTDKGKREEFLRVCQRASAEEFEFRLDDAENVRTFVGDRRATVRMTAGIDFFFCPNPLIAACLKDFGIDDKRYYCEESFVALEGELPNDAAAVERRAKFLARGYEELLGREKVAKQGIERENATLILQDLNERRLEWEGRPMHLELSTNNRCNLRCLMCSPETRPEAAAMTEDEARDICGQVFPRASVLTPSANSEPMLGDFALITELAREFGVQLNVITNGSLLAPERYETMADIIGRLQVSFDSHEKEAYETIRVGAKFERVVENIRQACELAARDGVEVMTSSVVMNMNWNKIAEYVDFVADLGVDTVALQELLILFPSLEAWSLKGKVSDEELQREIERAVETARRREVNLHVGLGRPVVHNFNKKKFRLFKLNYLQEIVTSRHPRFCYFVAMYAKIEPDGSVYPCCRSPKELKMGNVKKESFEKIWNNKKYRQLRKSFFDGKLMKCCRDCSLLGFKP